MRSIVDAETARSRIHAVGSKQLGPAYERIVECDLEIAGVYPHLGVFDETSVREGDVVLVGCSETMLLTPAFQRRIRRISQVARVVACASETSDASAGYAAQNGFHGYVRRDSDPGAVARTVRAVGAGELAFPRATLSALVQFHRRVAPLETPQQDDFEELTPRQQQIVELIAQGATDREIAEVLRISRSTAHKHVQNALRRTRARTRSQLAAGARPSGGSPFAASSLLWPLLQPRTRGKGAQAS